MIFSNLPSPAEAGFAKAETGIQPRIKSEGKLFRDRALKHRYFDSAS